MNNFVTRIPAARHGGKVQCRKYVDLLVDGNFKLIFSKEKNKPVLINLLNEFLPDIEVKEVTLIQQERRGRRKELKTGVFDMYCKTSDGRSIVVEVQYNPRRDYLDRMLYYSTWPISEQKKVSAKNYLLNEVYVLSFCNFALVHDSDWDQREGEDEPKIISSYSIREDGNGELMTNALHFIYVELGRFRKKEEELGTERDWCIWCLKNMGSMEEIPRSLSFRKVNELLGITEVESLPPDERDEYDRNMQNELDRLTERRMMEEEHQQALASAFNEGVTEGEVRGEARGEANKCREVAKKMLADGLDINTIAKYTGFSKSEIELLLN